jgi:hypothetical protein
MAHFECSFKWSVGEIFQFSVPGAAFIRLLRYRPSGPSTIALSTGRCLDGFLSEISLIYSIWRNCEVYTLCYYQQYILKLSISRLCHHQITDFMYCSSYSLQKQSFGTFICGQQLWMQASTKDTALRHGRVTVHCWYIYRLSLEPGSAILLVK